ncbi:MAG: branched-chain amino acid transaminase [Verrucomicrobia bacterium]|jgi:branched-chain amino acid aminotransferase|nr:branched-chain amino acid transaminase [Verrucomicrobiota bacterium]MBT7067264.1 branched-chain amino acid transaminase [Verrucomicrobiota bacterium]MBT7698662.1 branched-chain amino acid transaminase [Verrucomicrobiota bacterium]
MAFGEGKIWVDGKLVDWADATCHVMSHALHYGSSIFEGIRCYDTGAGTVIFRLGDHMRRLYESAKIYRMDIPFEQAALEQAVIDTVRENGLSSCYIRPLAFRGLGEMGVNPQKCPVNVVIAAWSWGKYLGEAAMEDGVSVRVSSWRRPAPDTFPTLAKAGGNYLNSQLIKMEATNDGFDEGIALDYQGFVSEGSGENIFLVRNGAIYTPPTSSSILPGITRHCVVTLAREMGIPMRQQVIPREALYVADEVFFSGTAAEITPVSKIDNIVIGEGRRGPVTERIQSAFFDIVEGRTPDTHDWFTPVA